MRLREGIGVTSGRVFEAYGDVSLFRLSRVVGSVSSLARLFYETVTHFKFTYIFLNLI